MDANQAKLAEKMLCVGQTNKIPTSSHNRGFDFLMEVLGREQFFHMQCVQSAFDSANWDLKSLCFIVDVVKRTVSSANLETKQSYCLLVQLLVLY